MRFTSFGRNCYAIGGNYEVAKYSGIKVVPIKWTAFVISGITAALAGVLLASRVNTGSSVYGDTTGMLVNCGVVIGGTSFAGGVGGIRESFIGLFVIQMLTNVMSMLGLDSYYQKLFEGILIVLIIGLDCFVRMRKRASVITGLDAEPASKLNSEVYSFEGQNYLDNLVGVFGQPVAENPVLSFRKRHFRHLALSAGAF